MNAQSFLENFGHLANAPNGSAQLRALIYHLAFAGDLAEHSTETAEALSDSLAEMESPGGKARRPLNTKVTSLHPIPEHWKWVNIGLIGHDWGQMKPEEEFTYIDVSSIDNKHGVIEKDAIARSATRAPSRARKIVRKGTVIYSTVRPYLLNIAIVDRDFDPAPIASTAFAILHPFPGVEAKFVYYFLRSPAFVSYVESVQSGIAYPAISDKKFFAASFPLAPSEEQKRIVAKVDELMALCDELEAQQQERERLFPVLSRATHTRFAESPTPENLRAIFDVAGSILPEEFRRSILTLAVSGKLVPFETDHKETVGDHIEFLNGYAFKSEWFRPIGARLCRNVNVSHGVLDWHDSAFVDDTIANEFDRFSLSEGDIVLSLDRPLIATGLKAARVQKHDLPCLLLQRVAKPVPKHDQFDLSYFFLWLNSPKFVDTIKPGRSNGVPHISTREVQRLDFVLPPLSTQLRIVAKVDQLIALVDQLEERQAQKSKVAATYAQAAVAAITGTQINESDPMKAPKTELITKLEIGSKPKATDSALLTNLIAKSKEGLSAKALWQQSGLEIDDFYQQLKTEMASGWIIESEPAVMRNVKAS